MKNITIIVPVHVFDETLLNRAINSIPDKENELYTLLFVGPKDICKKSEKLAKKCGIKFQIVSVENDDTDIQTQINKAVFSCVTKYFTVLEFDDEFTDFGEEEMAEMPDVPEDAVVAIDVIGDTE